MFFQGLLVGFSIAAPVGPIGVLCIRRTLSNGQLSGLISGLGAATADAFYGSIAAMGLTLISSFLIEQKIWLGVIGGLFLCYLGIKSFFERPQTVPEPYSFPSNITLVDRIETRNKKFFTDYVSTFFLTLTNPLTIISFTAIYAGLGLGTEDHNPLAGLWLVFGVFVGSSLWWLTLSSLSSIFREKFLTVRGLFLVNRISGIVLVVFGFGVLFSVMG